MADVSCTYWRDVGGSNAWEAWVAKHYRGPREPADVVESFQTESVPLLDLIERAGFGPRIDVLQIDVEGCDDLVIYASSIGVTQPSIINFEHVNLPTERLAELRSTLIDGDTSSARASTTPSLFALNLLLDELEIDATFN